MLFDPLGDAVSAAAEIGAGIFEATSLVEGGLSAGAHLVATGDYSRAVQVGVGAVAANASGLGSIAGGLADQTSDAVIDKVKEVFCE